MHTMRYNLVCVVEMHITLIQMRGWIRVGLRFALKLTVLVLAHKPIGLGLDYGDWIKV